MTKKTIKINNHAPSTLSNVLHTRLHKEVSKELDAWKKGYDVLHIENDDISEYKSTIVTAEDCNKEIGSSRETAQITEADANRDRMITYIFGAVRNAVNSPKEEEVKAANDLMPIIDKYNGLQREPMQQETTHINGLLIDFDKAPYDEALNRLNLDYSIQKLTEYNDEFDELYAKRRADSVSVEKLPPTKEVRQKLDDLFADFADGITSAYRSCKVDDTKKEISALADRINAIIDDVKAEAKRVRKANAKDK